MNLFKNLNPLWFLLVGIVTISMTHMSITVDVFAWFSTVPFLLYLTHTHGWKSRLLFVISLMMAWSVVVFKILSPPMPIFMIFLFSIPISLFHLPAYLVWDKFKDYKWSIFLFPTILTIMEWIQYTFTPFASWGVMAYSQSSSLSVMQLVSIFGMSGLSFLIYWVNVSIAQFMTKEKASLSSLYIPLSVLFVVVVFGSLRIDIGKSKGTSTMTVATVGTNSKVGGLPLPSKESNDKVIADLLKRTKKVGSFGAKVVVWNEASFFALPSNEKEIQDAIKTVAKDEHISIVASYVMPISENPFKYENKLVFVNENGDIAYSYLKHQPVPGEPAIQGTQPFQSVQIGKSKIGGVVCYDYDFPYIAKGNAKLNVDIVAVPSSDWRGIDPLHTQMAAFRAIEQGHSIIRSTRFGLSAIISPYGEMISQSSSFDDHDKIMIANIRTKGIRTFFSLVGNLFIYLCFAYLMVFSVWMTIQQKTANSTIIE